jgi:hypothetical protein
MTASLLKNHLQFKSQVANRFEYDALVRLPSSNHNSSNKYRIHLSLAKGSNELFRWSFTQDPFQFVSGSAEQRSVFGNYPFEQIQMGENR